MNITFFSKKGWRDALIAASACFITILLLGTIMNYYGGLLSASCLAIFAGIAHLYNDYKHRREDAETMQLNEKTRAIVQERHRKRLLNARNVPYQALLLTPTFGVAIIIIKIAQLNGILGQNLITTLLSVAITFGIAYPIHLLLQRLRTS